MAGINDQVAAAERMRAREEAIRRTVTAKQAKDIAAWARANPTLSAGAVLSAGRAGLDPQSPAGQTLQRADAARRQDKGGWSLGSVVSAPFRGIAKVAEEAKDAVEAGLEYTSRGVFGALSAPGEAIQQTFRENIANGGFDAGDLNPFKLSIDVARNLGDTTLGQGIQQAARGDDISKIGGTGFFMQGTAAEAQRRIARSTALTEDGKAVTLGRYLAQSLNLDADDRPYSLLSGLVDASVAIGTDPSTWVAGPLTKAKEARKLFAGNASKGFDRAAALEEAGALNALRNTVASDRAIEWLTTGKGKQVVQYLANETDFARLWETTGRRFDPKTVRRLQDATSDVQVMEVLAPMLGKTAGLDKKFDVAARGLAAQGMGKPGIELAAKIQRGYDSVRMFGNTPSRLLKVDDLGDAVTQMDRFLRNAKIDAPVRSQLLQRLADTDGADQMYEVVADAMSAGVSRAAPQIGEQKARDLFKIWKDKESDNRTYWFGRLADGSYGNKFYGDADDVMKLSDGTVRAVPHLASEFLSTHVPLPDFREIRRSISPFSRVLTNPAIDVPRFYLEKVTDGLFKPLALLRPAYVVRIGIDEQFRPAGVGLASLFSHPVQYLNWALTDSGRLGRALKKAGMQTERGDIDILGQQFDEGRQAVLAARQALRDAKNAGDDVEIAAAKARVKDAQQAQRAARPLTEAASHYQMTMEGGVGNWRNRDIKTLRSSQRYRREDNGFSKALGEELHLLHNDQTGLAKRIAQGGPYQGDSVTEQGIDGIKEWWWSGKGQGLRKDLAKNGPRMDWITTREGADAYIDSIVERIDDATGGAPELREAIAHGSVRGRPLTDGDTLEISVAALREMDAMKAAGIGPEVVSGSMRFAGVGPEQAGAWDRVVDRLFYEIAARPSNKAARSPVFRQRYYQRMENLIEFSTPATQDEIIKAARAAKLPEKQIKRLERNRTRGQGDLILADVDDVAKADAMEFTRDLLYDLTTRNQFFDAARVLFPFGEAFKEAAKTYTRISIQRPQVPYRLGLTLQGGRDLDPDGDGKGFFSYDPASQQEVFNLTSLVPGAGALMEQAFGARGFNAPVGGLNMLGTSVLPGVGPVVQISAGYLLPDKPEYNGLQKLISPFGERTAEGGFVESFLPAWAQKLRTVTGMSTPAQQRQFANAAKDIAVYLISTGEYNASTPEEMDRTLAEARKRAKYLYLLRGLVQSTAPSPPIPELLAVDKSGQLVSQFAVRKRYDQLRKDDPENATQRFLEEFGDNLAGLMVSKAPPAEGRIPLPPTTKGKEFRQRNPGTVSAHSRVIGLFVDDDESEEVFDSAEYQRQIQAGERITMSPQETLRQANRRVATQVYKFYKKQAGDDISDTERRKLKELQQQLMRDYPGYDNQFRDDVPSIVNDLERAVKDPVLATTPQGQALQIFLDYRRQANDAANRRFGVTSGYAQADRAKPIRDKMRALAARLGEDYPGFTNLYERSFEREMVDDL